MKEEDEKEDMLKELFRLQEAYDKRVQEDKPFCDWSQRKRLSSLLSATIQELQEAINKIGYIKGNIKKWWSDEIKFEESIEESIDALHFLLSFWIHIGVSAEELFTFYKEKNKINHERQDTGY